MVEAAHRGELDVLYSCGGNFLEVLPDPDQVREALERVPLRVHQDVVVTTQMLLEPGEEVVLLPAATRYEQRDGGTETTTERRVVYGPQVVAPVGAARTEWEIFLDLARRVDPPLPPHRVLLGRGHPRRDRQDRPHLPRRRDPVQARRQPAMGW